MASINLQICNKDQLGGPRTVVSPPVVAPITKELVSALGLQRIYQKQHLGFNNCWFS